DPRVPRQTPDAAHQHHRAERAAVMLEPRREIGDLDRAALRVGQSRDEHGRVVLVALLDAGLIEDLDGEEAHVLAFAGAVLEQRAEHRIAVEAGEAGPVDLAPLVDERADRPVADQREIERSHCSTALTLRRRQRAAVRPGPTLIECPPSLLTVANPYSSVASSPTNTGIRPRNGPSCMNSRTPTPLFFPAGRISTTYLPR